MIVYFYEKLSDGLYAYNAPAPTPSRLNIPFFVSNGYLVFAPDISYEKGYPGKSAEEFINSGVESLKKNAWVDGTKIGIQGQSWGGYQVAHLITRTNMYAAAWSGAPCGKHDFCLWWNALGKRNEQTVPIRKNTKQDRCDLMGKTGFVYRKLAFILPAKGKYAGCNHGK
jgi:hypothetical protein